VLLIKVYVYIWYDGIANVDKMSGILLFKVSTKEEHRILTTIFSFILMWDTYE